MSLISGATCADNLKFKDADYYRLKTNSSSGDHGGTALVSSSNAKTNDFIRDRKLR
jgi:hypothetical protein